MQSVAPLCRSPGWLLIIRDSRCRCKRSWEANFIVGVVPKRGPTSQVLNPLVGWDLIYMSDHVWSSSDPRKMYNTVWSAGDLSQQAYCSRQTPYGLGEEESYLPGLGRLGTHWRWYRTCKGRYWEWRWRCILLVDTSAETTAVDEQYFTSTILNSLSVVVSFPSLL